jgi:hypothetical protein
MSPWVLTILSNRFFVVPLDHFGVYHEPDVSRWQILLAQPVVIHFSWSTLTFLVIL